MANRTVTFVDKACESVTVNWNQPVFSRADTEAIASVGVTGGGCTSSFVIVPVAEAVCTRALAEAPESVTANVSFASNAVSPITSTRIVFDVSPGANESGPLWAT